MLDPGAPLDEVQRLAGRADLRPATRLGYDRGQKRVTLSVIQRRSEST